MHAHPQAHTICAHTRTWTRLVRCECGTRRGVHPVAIWQCARQWRPRTPRGRRGRRWSQQPPRRTRTQRVGSSCRTCGRANEHRVAGVRRPPWPPPAVTPKSMSHGGIRLTRCQWRRLQAPTPTSRGSSRPGARRGKAKAQPQLPGKDRRARQQHTGTDAQKHQGTCVSKQLHAVHPLHTMQGAVLVSLSKNTVPPQPCHTVRRERQRRCHSVFERPRHAATSFPQTQYCADVSGSEAPHQEEARTWSNGWHILAGDASSTTCDEGEVAGCTTVSVCSLTLMRPISAVTRFRQA